jgi:hypothetical protein
LHTLAARHRPGASLVTPRTIGGRPWDNSKHETFLAAEQQQGVPAPLDKNLANTAGQLNGEKSWRTCLQHGDLKIYRTSSMRQSAVRHQLGNR